MGRVAARVFCAVALFMGVAVGIETPAVAVQAGQFCANAQAGAVTTAENGATVRCVFNSNSPVWRSTAPAAASVGRASRCGCASSVRSTC